MKHASSPAKHFSPKTKRILFFLGKFFLIYFVLQFLILVADFSFLENWLADIESDWVQGTVSGNSITIGKEVFAINAQCTGLVSAIILAAVVFSLNRPNWKTKFQLWLVGAIVLFVLNIGRLFLVLGIAKQYGIGAAEIAHQVSWFSTAVFILGIWLVLSKQIAKVKSVSELVE